MDFALGSAMPGTSRMPELAVAARIASYGRISGRGSISKLGMEPERVMEPGPAAAAPPRATSAGTPAPRGPRRRGTPRRRAPAAARPSPWRRSPAAPGARRPPTQPNGALMAGSGGPACRQRQAATAKWRPYADTSSTRQAGRRSMTAASRPCPLSRPHYLVLLAFALAAEKPRSSAKLVRHRSRAIA